VIEDSSSTVPRFVHTRVGRLAVRIVGSGPPAVLWHSLFVDSHSWDRVVEQLSSARTLVIIDGPSSGASEPLFRLSSIQECAEAALDVMNHLDLRRVDWVGNAWGGHVGIVLAATFPDRVRSLCCIGTPTFRLVPFKRVQIVTLLPVVRAFGFLPFIERILTSALLADRTRSTDPEAVRIVVSGFTNVNRRAFGLALRSFSLRRPDLTSRLPQLHMPVLLAAGDDRGETSPLEVSADAAAAPDARAATLAGVRGIAPLDDPAAVIALVLTFWASHDNAPDRRD
jgi:pimeloyl-ACP methyl ester carboxylesterase